MEDYERVARIEQLSEKIYALCQGENYEIAWQSIDRAKSVCLTRAIVPMSTSFQGNASADAPQQCG